MTGCESGKPISRMLRNLHQDFGSTPSLRTVNIPLLADAMAALAEAMARNRGGTDQGALERPRLSLLTELPVRWCDGDLRQRQASPKPLFGLFLGQIVSTRDLGGRSHQHFFRLRSWCARIHRTVSDRVRFVRRGGGEWFSAQRPGSRRC